MCYTAYGDCYYVFSKLCTQSLFTVLGELRPCGKKETETCLVGVTVILNDEETLIELNPSGDVYVNFIYTQLPISAASFTIFRPSPLYIVLNTNFGLQIISQILPIMQLYVVLKPSYTSQTCGLCGNYNNRQSDEFKIISGIVEGTAVSFINTWKTEANCPSANIVFDHPCSISVESDVYAKHWCGLLLDPDDIFGPCHILVNPNIYYQNCLIDTCSCEKSEECMCAALASYAKLCAANGVVLYGWRQKACYKYTQCPNNLVFSYSVTSYQPTCRSISEPDMICKVLFDPLEGCVCNKGYYLDKSGKCVPAISCPCYYRGLPIASGESINDRGVTCTCNKGNLTCTGSYSEVCTAPMVFVDCSKSEPGTNGAECFKSCQTLDLQCYSTRCKSGCVCPPGLVSDENGGCIDPINCPCIHNEAIYNTGDEIKIRCNTCVCKDRMWKCTNNTCLSTCTVYGDGHYITFDGKRYSFNGDCQYTLAEDYCNMNSSESNFRIITENIACGTTGTTCSKSIKIFLGTFELILADDHLNVVERGFGVPVPYRIRLMGIYLVIETKSGLLLLWDKKTSIFIKVTSEYKEKLCGLCGNYDGNRNNDFTTRGNAVVASADEFGNSWKMSINCPDAKDTKDPCIINPYRQSWAQKQCSIINSNVFSACHPHVDPLKYYEACVSDSCACNTGGDCECFCTAVAAYALACGDLGICISWRTPIICPLFCDYYNRDGNCEWHYKACGSHCMKTCRNPMGKCSYEIRGLEGCYPKCPEDKPYFDEDEMECVSVCGCFDGDRKHYKLGAIVPTNENCTVCFCTLNGIECKYKVEACKCEYQGKIYKYNEVIYNTTDNIGGCFIAICKENGTIYREVLPCPTVSTTSARTAPLEFTTGSSTVCISEIFRDCSWTKWYDVSYPKPDNNGGDFETYDNIRKNGLYVCEKPENISCRAAKFPGTPLDNLGQSVTCDINYGLVCLNKDQDTSIPVCYNYEISVYCCREYKACKSTTTSVSRTSTTAIRSQTTTESATSTTQRSTTPLSTTTTTKSTTSTAQSTTTPRTTLSTTPPTSTTTESSTSKTQRTTTQVSTISPTATATESAKSTTQIRTTPLSTTTTTSGSSTSTKKSTPLSTLSTFLTSTITESSTSKTQRTTTQVSTISPTTTESAKSTTQMRTTSLSTISPTTTATESLTSATQRTTTQVSTKPLTTFTTERTTSTTKVTTTSPTMASTKTSFYTSQLTTTQCYCYFNNSVFLPGELIYNVSDGSGCYSYAICGKNCVTERYAEPCPTPVTPTSTPQPTTPPPSSFSSSTSTFSTLSPTTKLEDCGTRKINETWINENCTKSICYGNNNITTEPLICPPVDHKPCFNGLAPVRISSENGCCYEYVCGVCVGPDGLPSMPGDIWSCNCNNCSCNVHTLTVICKPVQCPPLVNETCTLKGYIVVPKVDPENPCCMKTECRCNTSSCIQIEESCPIGFRYVVTYTGGNCCLNYNCVPMDVCVVNNSTYKPGEVIPNTDNPCERCKCTDDKDNISMLNKVKCVSRVCDSCSPGYTNQIIKGTCCGTCNKVSCIKTLDNGTTIFLEPGEKWNPPNEPCVYYKCDHLKDTFDVITIRKTCHICEPGYEYEKITGSCCGKCTIYACVFTVDNTTTNILEPGQTWTPPGKPCTTYVCNDNFVLKEKNIVCAPLDLSKCQEGTIVTDEYGCCRTCQLKDVCTKFLTNENITFDNCVTETEVEVAYCTGYCDSTSGYSMTLMMENKCSCCQPRKTSMKDCKLTCQNGTTVDYSYTFIEECGCDVLKCVKLSYDLLSTTIKP